MTSSTPFQRCYWKERLERPLLESRMKAVHMQDTVKVVRGPWGLLEDGLSEARRLIEAEQFKGGWGSADIKLRMPTQSRTHGATKLGLERHGSGLVKNLMLMNNKYV
ncbi:hypothetical protein B9Z55_027128 [Caenorhabditis nigoni]|uniref:Uncharacterized protein n=1 Tax=Caenorhabditis nigoni TaxID=1611254 RepID=A0A2G5SIY9_9PELO|nr:hypothetical protein B9Z55_027128 [Caenorhabditis nigoni]